MRATVWREKVPADVRPKLRAAAETGGRRLREQIEAGAPRDVEAMKKRDLTVVAVDAAARRQWRALTEGLYPRIRGTIVPADAFDEALKARAAYRTAHPVAPAPGMPAGRFRTAPGKLAGRFR